VLLPAARRQWKSRWTARVFVAFVAGTSSGALATALGLWLLSGLSEPLPDAARLYALAGAGVLVLAVRHSALARRVNLPEARRQIPAEVLAGDATRGALRFGLELGTGLRTYVPAVAPYLLALTIFAARPGLYVALLAGLGFGIARGLPLLVRALSPEISMYAVQQSAVRFAPALAGFAVFVGGLTLVP
jgi:hypothetical protein